MIAYNETLNTFYKHVNQNVIANMVQEKLGMRVGESEQRNDHDPAGAAVRICQ